MGYEPITYCTECTEPFDVYHAPDDRVCDCCKEIASRVVSLYPESKTYPYAPGRVATVITCASCRKNEKVHRHPDEGGKVSLCDDCRALTPAERAEKLDEAAHVQMMADLSAIGAMAGSPS
jgi:hypothetical protein